MLIVFKSIKLINELFGQDHFPIDSSFDLTVSAHLTHKKIKKSTST